MRVVVLFLLLVIALAPLRADDLDHRRDLALRVRLEPEDAWADPLRTVDEHAIAALAGQAAWASLPHATTGLEIAAAGVLERMANDRYEQAFHEYRGFLQGDRPTLLFRLPMLDPSGTDVVRSRDARSIAQERMLRLPASYRDRYLGDIDAEARRLLDKGTRELSPEPLRRLVAEHPPGEKTDRALALLGDLAFERGDFDTALLCWRRIVSLPTQASAARRDVAVDVPRIRAKQILALVFAGDPRGSREIEAFRTLHPDALGSLAGMSDRYHAILTRWQQRILEAGVDDSAEAWPTFAGSPSRNRVVPRGLSPRLWFDGAAWKTPLPLVESGPSREPVWLSSTRSLTIPPTPIHPVIADGQLLFSDGQTVRSYDLVTGTLKFRASSAAPFVRPNDLAPASDQAFSLSVADGVAYARLGIRPYDGEPRRLAAIDLGAGRRGRSKDLPPLDRVLWTADANGDVRQAFFETDPLVVGDNLYIGVQHKGEPRTARVLTCYSLSGTLRWQAKLAEIVEEPNRRPGRQSLLAASGSTIVYATDAGVVCGIDGWTGRRLWAVRYPRIDSGPSPRGASTCVIADGRVYLAPIDSTHLYCLDAETGYVFWERPWLRNRRDIVAAPAVVSDIVDLLGVVGDRLVFTDRQRLQAIDTRTGTVVWMQPDPGRLPTLGRGLLAGPWAYWPTADADVSWRAVSADDGSLHQSNAAPPHYELTSLRHLPAGNLIFGQGCLAVAGPTELTVYVPNARLLPRLLDDPQVRRDPARLYRLALARLDAPDIGGPDAAAQAFADLERLVPVGERSAWANLIRARTSPRPREAAPTPRATEPMSVSPALVRPTPEPTPVARLTPRWHATRGVAPPVETSARSRHDDVVAVLDGADLAVLDVRTGVELFRRPRRISTVDWLGRHDAYLLLAGPDGVEAFDLERRRAAWHFVSPSSRDARWRLVDDRPRLETKARPLTAFQFVERLLTCFDGDRLFALDPETGTIVAERSFDAIAAMESPRQFQPGSAWAGASVSPERLLDEWMPPWDGCETTVSAARQGLIRVDARTWLRGESGGRVRLIDGDPERGMVYEPRHTTSLTGAPARVAGSGNVLFAVTPRNQGDDLIRLERDGMWPRWTASAFELREGIDLAAFAWDQRHAYLVHAGELIALSIETGKRVWATPLPPASGRWRLEHVGDRLLVWSQSTAGIPNIVGPGHPIAAALSLQAGRRGIGSAPIVLIDPADGRVVQRIDVPHDGGPVFAVRHGSRLIVTASNQVRGYEIEKR